MRLLKFLNTKFNKIDYSKYTFKWFFEQKKGVFLDFIEKKALEVAESEGIKIYFVSYSDMNKEKLKEENKAVGRFIYYNKEYREEYNKYIRKRFGDIKPINIPREDALPRIEISELCDVFTIIHELGHYFLEKRNQEQSEDAANMYVEEFFDKYLPPFFKWIYQIDIKIRTKKEYNFTPEECYNYWEEYNKFTNNYGVH